MASPKTSRKAASSASNDETRQRIAGAAVDLIGQFGAINHDAVAEHAGVSRRTVYRYFPDQTALLRGAREHVQGMIGPNVRMPESESDLIDQLDDIYTGFDRIEAVSILMRTTPQGRAIRLADRDKRQARYRAATADAVKDLPEPDQRIATAMLQFLHTTAWLEMHDQWGLSGEEIARSCRWAMKTLLADLRARGGRPLDEEPGA
ncbi:TetR/AcrR family transcriptional regulator [Sphingobium sp. H33]|uniref:TetR/AcrR family transcriptional regulator n=2 Tax=Sphingobium nicotianae TaxID=2782607 RepID=A0A9X1DF92_9SPHN|nr:TetR/AcrR family transcriptional regulator [Sphingobium nicotianae]